MFGARISDRDRQRMAAELDFLRMDEPSRTVPPRASLWTALRVPTGGVEHVGAPLGRLASVR